MECLNDNALLSYIESTLSTEERVRVQQHLDTCAKCRMLISSIAGAGSTGVGRGSSDLPFRVLSAPICTFESDELIAGRYRVVRFLARGGMGEVYEAFDQELKERVALKAIRPEIAANEETRKRFKREILIARKVTHPNVCRIFDLGIHRLAASGGGEDGEIIFLSMELLTGETLAQRLKAGGRMKPASALPLMRQMAEALHAAHQAGVIHRDFKSSNVFLVPHSDKDKSLRVVVTDFGLSHIPATGQELDGAVTMPGAMIGTPAYMAPEQVDGRALSEATDVYALGVVMYEMLAGAWPFVADTPLALATKRLTESPTPLRQHCPDLDPRWSAIIERCLARDPAARFQHAKDLLPALADMDLARPVETGSVSHESSMAKLFDELKRRHMLRFAAVYGAVSWLLIQVAGSVVPALGLPTWLLPFVIIFALCGFPAGLVLAWMLKRGPSSTPGAPAAPALRGQHAALIMVIVLSLGAAVLSVVLRKYGAKPAATSTSARSGGTSKWLAVLPFENLSQTPETGYFADGIHEDILTNLAKVKELKVISRTSVLQYKSGARNLRQIGEALGVGVILEGSVRRAGERVRITAQLIDANSDQHLWAETYDRELRDVFAIQGDVASKIAAALNTQLLPTEKAKLAPQTPASISVYDLHLRGRAAFGRFSKRDCEEAITLFQQAIAQDSNYAPAYAMLSASYTLRVRYGRYAPAGSNSLLDMAIAAAEQALRIDPMLVEGHMGLGFAYAWKGWLHRAIAAYEKALSLDPNQANALRGLATIYGLMGRHEKRFELEQRALLIDPNSSMAYLGHVDVYRDLGEKSRVTSWLRRAIPYAESPDFKRKLEGLLKAHGQGPAPHTQILQEAREQLKEDPQDLAMISQAARAAYELGDLETALGYLIDAEKVASPESIDYPDRLGSTIEVLYKLGRKADVEQRCQQFNTFAESRIAAGHEAADVYELQATCSRLLGHKEEAYARLRKGLSAGLLISKENRSGPAFDLFMSDPELKQILAITETKLEELRKKVRQLELSAGGLFSREQIRAIVSSHSAEIQRCYQPVLAKNGGRGGDVVVSFVILGSGQVATPLVESTSLNDESVERCLMNALDTWTFPNPQGGGRIVLTYPFSWPIHS